MSQELHEHQGLEAMERCWRLTGDRARVGQARHGDQASGSSDDKRHTGPCGVATKPLRWSAGKNEILQLQQGVSCEAGVVAIESGDLLGIVEHPNQARYPGQHSLVVLISGYAQLVPSIEADDHLVSQNHHSQPQSHHRLPPSRPTMNPLDHEEQEILESFEAGTLRSVASAAVRSRLEASARSTASKDQRINIRLSSEDLGALHARALQEGIPYQTLISSVLHKYVCGRLLDRP
jgi:predicted DNA binding CopG/RHH family protein